METIGSGDRGKRGWTLKQSHRVLLDRGKNALLPQRSQQAGLEQGFHMHHLPGCAPPPPRGFLSPSPPLFIYLKQSACTFLRDTLRSLYLTRIRRTLEILSWIMFKKRFLNSQDSHAIVGVCSWRESEASNQSTRWFCVMESSALWLAYHRFQCSFNHREQYRHVVHSLKERLLDIVPSPK